MRSVLSTFSAVKSSPNVSHPLSTPAVALLRLWRSGCKTTLRSARCGNRLLALAASESLLFRSCLLKMPGPCQCRHGVAVCASWALAFRPSPSWTVVCPSKTAADLPFPTCAPVSVHRVTGEAETAAAGTARVWRQWKQRRTPPTFAPRRPLRLHLLHYRLWGAGSVTAADHKGGVHRGAAGSGERLLRHAADARLFNDSRGVAC